ncbi:MAG: HypC/HybG/HupF family hydrogenase formation chaperone, partial [Clostridiaceae bacterium]|nr:HypC/HybG/HupF family hydrogenase formation chaperone [Clostridiaceae bacterium]
MCLAVPGEIIEIRGKKALVDILGNTLEVSIEL